MLFRTRGFPSDKFIISPEEASFKNYFLKGVFLLYNELQRTEFNGVLVLTTQQLAEAYGADRKTVSYNFNHNRDRFVEGKHYIKLENEEKVKFLNRLENHDSLKNAKTLYLWTEKGAFLHAKSLNTDNAWEVYDRLVDDYFRQKQKRVDYSQLSPELRMFYTIADEQARIELQQKKQAEQIRKVENRVESIREVVAINSDSWRTETSNLIKKIGIALGGGLAYSEVRNEIYGLLEKRMGVNLGMRLTNKRRRMAEEGVSKTARDKVTLVDVIAEDKKLIEGYIAIVKETAIKYGVGK